MSVDPAQALSCFAGGRVEKCIYRALREDVSKSTLSYRALPEDVSKSALIALPPFPGQLVILKLNSQVFA